MTISEASTATSAATSPARPAGSPASAERGAASGYPTTTGPAPARVRWCLGTRLLVTAALGWSVLLLAHLLLTGRWWLWLVFEAAPPPLFVLVPAVLLAVTPWARPVRRPVTLLLAVTLAVGAVLAGPHLGVPAGPWAASGGTSVDAPPGAVKIFVLNTDIWESTEEDPDAFYGYLRAQDADVYLLQEYLYWDDGPVRIDATARLRAEFPGYEIIVEGEMLTLTRLPVVATHPRAVPTTGTDWYWRGRKAQRTDLRVGSAVLSVYNVHLHVPFRMEHSPLGGEFYRFVRDQYANRSAELDALRADVSANPHPMVVAGDFNSPWIDTLVETHPELRRHDPDTAGTPLATSWPTATYRLPRLWRLDWLFTTADVRVDGHRYQPAGEVSDHFGQQMWISLP